MKLSNETKVGLLAIVAIVGLVLGFNYLKGKHVLSKPTVYYAKFSNIGSLEKSNLVKVNGLTVGSVYDLKPVDPEANNIIVAIQMTRDIKIPDNAVAFIDGTVLSAAFITIEKPSNESRRYLQPGDTINTRLDKGLLGNLQSQLTPTIGRVNATLDSLKITLGAVNSVLDPTTNSNLRAIIVNLTNASANLNRMLNAENGVLASTLGNMNSVASNLAKNNDAITSSIRNVEVTTSKLANANIEGTVAALKGTIEEMRSTINKLTQNNGTLGLLVNDRGLYDKLNNTAGRLNTTALSAQILLDDIRMHPKRYVNISVFGGKTKGTPLTSPLVTDTVATR